MPLQGPIQGGVSQGSQGDADFLFRLRAEVGGSNFVFETDVLHDGIKWGKSANFTQTPILNRSSPIITYANSSPIMLSVTLNLFVTNGDNKLDGGPTFVIDILESVTSLTFPVTPGIEPPTLCYITLPGFSMFEEWPCVVPNFEASYGQHNAWNKDRYPMTGAVSIQFMGVEVENVKASQWLRNPGNYRQSAFRGSSGGAAQNPNVSGSFSTIGNFEANPNNTTA